MNAPKHVFNTLVGLGIGLLSNCLPGVTGPHALHAQVLAVNAPTVPSQGSGLLVFLSDECLLVVPKHVVSPGSRDVELRDGSGRSFPGSVFHEDPQEDLALVRPQFPTQPFCEEWPRTEEAQATLAGSRYGYLLYAAPSGAEHRIEVEIALPPRGTNISVWPRDAAVQLHDGMSGAGLYIDGTPVGMLIEASVRSRRGVAYSTTFVSERIRPGSTGLPSPWVRTVGMQLWVSRGVVVASACPEPKIRANWEEGGAVVDAQCSGEWIMIDFDDLRTKGLVRTAGYYCIRMEDGEGRHRSLEPYPSWRSRTYFSDGENVGVRVNEDDVVITERAYQSRFDDRCRLRAGR